LEKTVEIVGKHTEEQQNMATQIAEIGRVVAGLTLAQMRFEEAHSSGTDTRSEISTDLKEFQSKKETASLRHAEQVCYSQATYAQSVLSQIQRGESSCMEG
jgi:hypothetical protein